MTQRYTLEVSAEQAQLLVQALDHYSRTGIGQFEDVINVYDHDYRMSLHKKEELRAALNLAKGIAEHLASGSYGIRNPKVADKFRQAYDIQQVIRNRLAFDRKPEGDITVDFDEPRQISSVPLPTIRRLPTEAELNPRCPECGGDLGGTDLGRLETHKAGCPRFPL